VRTSASANFFLGIAIAIVAALFALFVLWPVWSRRGKRGGGAQPAVPKATQESKPQREPPLARKGAAKRASFRRNGAPLTDDEAKVVEELDREFENEVKGQPPA